MYDRLPPDWETPAFSWQGTDAGMPRYSEWNFIARWPCQVNATSFMHGPVEPCVEIVSVRSENWSAFPPAIPVAHLLPQERHVSHSSPPIETLCLKPAGASQRPPAHSHRHGMHCPPPETSVTRRFAVAVMDANWDLPKLGIHAIQRGRELP